MKHIFIGGTGRSGTSILLHALSFHPQLYTIPIETKFLVQVDGLHMLARYITDDFAPNESAVALARFRKLMYEVITHTGDNPYADFPDAPYGRLEFLPQEVFQNYYTALDRFFEDLHPNRSRRQPFIERSRRLLDALFGDQATLRGCDGWVEKTPSNFVRIEFLYELYPDALFINCIRDPRGVLHSFQRLKWLSGSVEDGAEYLASYYELLEQKREFGLSRPGQYHEVRLEELVADPNVVLGNLLGFLGVTPYDQERQEYLSAILKQGSLHWSPELGRYQDVWEREYSDATIATISDRLSVAIKQYGYSL